MNKKFIILKQKLSSLLTAEKVDWGYFNKILHQTIIHDPEYSGETDKTKEILNAYVKTVNKIDDFFEYRNESKSDRKFINERLSDLNKALSKISKGK